MSGNGKTGADGGGDEFVPLDDDGFSADEMAAIERMQSETPMPTKNEGGDPADIPADEPRDGKPRPIKQADAGDSEADELEDGEISLDAHGKAHDASGKYVPKSALLRVKEDRKKARDELATERAQRAKLEGRFELLAEALNAQPGDGKAAAGKAAPTNPWDEADIDPEQDIFKAFDQQKRRNAYERQQREGLASSQVTRDRQVATVNAYVADAKRAVAENIKNGEMLTVGEGENAKQIPAFQAAYLHLVEQSHARLEVMGITDKAARDARIHQEERELIEQAIAQNRSPADIIMGLAKAAGFKMPSKAAANGKTPQQLAAERKLDQVGSGMRATQSLSGKGGQAATGLTAAQIIAMDDASFDSFVGKLSEDQLNKLLGA